MASQTNPKQFKVIISGGGIAGLTLANALQHADIDFILLERRREIAPQVGASIGILPNGARILDQLDCFDAIAAQMEPLVTSGEHYADGTLITERGDMAQLFAARTGYEPAFLDRQLVLKVLYDNIWDKSKVLLGKELDEVEHSQEGVRVHCKDGSVFDGDVIAGADGVMSGTRQQMWKAASKQDPKAIPKKDREAIFSEYNCLFGISNPSKDQRPGDLDVTFAERKSSLVIIGKGGRTFWFMFKRLPKRCGWDKIPKYTMEDAIACGEEFRDWPIHADDTGCPSGPVTFGDIWEKRLTFCLVPLEEAEYKVWTWGRFVCLGDGIHKMTPNAGAGGNSAIESAAALANALKDLKNRKKGVHPTFDEVQKSLKVYQEKRELRTSELMKVANGLTRIHALNSLSDKFMAYFVIPKLGDVLLEMQCDLFIGAEMLNYLPPPPKSFTGTMPFNPDHGVGKKEWRSLRALLALPFLGLFYLAWQKMLNGSPMAPYAEDIVSKGVVMGPNGPVSLPHTFFGIKALDDTLKTLVALFAQWNMGTDVEGSWQIFTFLTDYAVLHAIFLIESARRANTLTLAWLPVAFSLLAQLFSIGITGNIYWFLFWALTPIETFRAWDMRLTDLRYTRGILPALALGYYLPHFLSLCSPSLENRLWWESVWQLFPVWVSVIQWTLATFAFTKTITEDRLRAPLRDLPAVKCAIAVPMCVSVSVWWYTLALAPVSWTAMFVPTWDQFSLAGPVEFMRNIIQWDEVFCFGCAFLCMAYMTWDFKAAGMVRTSWVKLVMVAAASIAVMGPGAALGFAWLWRENILATKRHKGAIVKGLEMQYANGIHANGKHVNAEVNRLKN